MVLKRLKAASIIANGSKNRDLLLQIGYVFDFIDKYSILIVL